MSDPTERICEGAQLLLEKASDLQERIRRRAHAIWEREGRPHGRDQDHWREAESELGREETAKKSAAAKVQAKPAAAPAMRARAPKPVPARR